MSDTPEKTRKITDTEIRYAVSAQTVSMLTRLLTINISQASMGDWI